MTWALEQCLVFPPPVGAAQMCAERREGSDRPIWVGYYPGHLAYAAKFPAVQPNTLDWDLNRSSRPQSAGLTRVNPSGFPVRARRRKDVHDCGRGKKCANYRSESVDCAD